MFDTNLMFHSAATLTTTGVTPTALDVGKTPAAGVDVEIVVTSLAGSAGAGLTLAFSVEECDTTNGTWVALATFPSIIATGRHNRVVQSKRRYLRLPLTAGTATGLSAVVTAGIVSGQQRDMAA